MLIERTTMNPTTHLDVCHNLGLSWRMHVEAARHLGGDVVGMLHAHALGVLRLQLLCK